MNREGKMKLFCQHFGGFDIIGSSKFITFAHDISLLQLPWNCLNKYFWRCDMLTKCHCLPIFNSMPNDGGLF